MSNVLAIAATTATLRNLLTRGGVSSVTVRPPDKAREELITQINLFLYQTALDGFLRNTPMPGQLKQGESGFPPIPLTLYYLITAYGENDDETESHKVLGRSMSILHDHCLLGRQEIINATDTEVVDHDLKTDLQNQIERIRITPHALSVDEMSKLWTIFQTGYRVSIAYQVSVVLIESTRPSLTPLPVLTRGRDDGGISANANLVPPFPTISSLTLPRNRDEALPGDRILLTGYHLGGSSVSVRLTSQRLAQPRVELASGNDESVSMTLPDLPVEIPAGLYTVAVIVTKTGEADRLTNEFPLLLAPSVTRITPATVPAGSFTLTAAVKPEIRPEQRVALLFGNMEVLAEPHLTQTATVIFHVVAPQRGKYYVRLRVDGVDSPLVDHSVSPPQFDQTQLLEVT